MWGDVDEAGLSLEAWIDRVVAFDLEVGTMPEARVFARCREVAARWTDLGFDDEQAVALLFHLKEALGAIAFGTAISVSEVELEAIDVAHELLLAMSARVTGDQLEASLTYLWHKICGGGDYRGLDPDEIQPARNAHPMAVHPAETWKVYRRIFDRVAEEALSKDGRVAYTGITALELFRGPRKDAALRTAMQNATNRTGPDAETGPNDT